MKLHELSTLRTHNNQRVGRSGKRGSYSGRGQKGQRSRSGHRIRPAERDIILKLPKLRGFRNKQKDENPEVFNIGMLVTKFASHAKGGAMLLINRELLRTAKLIGKDYKGIVKVLGTGAVSISVTVEGFQVSASAKAKIEKAGGKVS